MSTAVPYIFAVIAGLVVAPRLRPGRPRQILFLAASYLIYFNWSGWLLLILIGSSAMNFLLGNWLRSKPTLRRLWVGIVANVLLLSLYKYIPVIVATFTGESTVSRSLAALVMPIGISFWTFQALSYLFDVYRTEPIDPSFLEFLLYMAFWPVVVSGPICRLPTMLPQFRSALEPTAESAGAGLKRIFTGLFMVAGGQLLAFGLAPGYGLNAALNRSAVSFRAPDVWCLAIGCGIQLFLDFAGYSNLAIGTAGLFGIEIPENFAQPYLATTPSEFWARWHMSLSFWIRDYVFLPMALLRRNGWWRNLLLVFSMVLFGIWHRASWNFVLWGAYNGFLLLTHRLIQRVWRRFGVNLPEWTAAPSWILTFCFTMLGWIFFRVDDVRKASMMVLTVFSPNRYRGFELPFALYVLVTTTIVGYFFVVLSSRLLDRALEEKPLAYFAAYPHLRLVIEMACRDRWVWAGPITSIVALYVYSVVKTDGASLQPFLYRLF